MVNDALEPNKYLYRGHELNIAVVVKELATKIDGPITQVHGRFISLYLREGPKGYAKQRDVYAHYPEYRLIRSLMAAFLLSLKPIRGVENES